MSCDVNNVGATGITLEFSHLPIPAANESAEDLANYGPNWGFASKLTALYKYFDAATTATFTDPRPTPQTQGGIVSGSTFAAEPLVEMWRTFLYPYQFPAFSSFSISDGPTAIREVNDSIPSGTLLDFRWTTTNGTNVVANSIDITDMPSATEIISNTANDGDETYTLTAPISYASPASHAFQIRGENTSPTSPTTFASQLSFNWRWRMFWDDSLTVYIPGDTVPEPFVEGFTNQALSTSPEGTYTFSEPASPTYKYFAVHNSFARLELIDTATSLPIPIVDDKTIAVTIDRFGTSQLYDLYRTANALGSAITIRLEYR